jgi:type VI secretion system protein ImpC
MSRTSSLTSVHIDVDEEAREAPREEPDAPFRILVAGNFSGGVGRNRKPVAVDRDNFEEVLEFYHPELRIPVGNSTLTISIRDLDDFHPDRLYERLAGFQELRGLREQLEEGVLPPQADPELSNVSGADLLSAMMGDAPAVALAKSRSAWDAMLQEIVAPYGERKPDSRQGAMIAQTDTAIAGEMRALLHRREFQELEALWRGLFFLVRRLETSNDLKVYVWDMPQAGLLTGEGLTELRRVAVEETVGTPGAERWSLLVGAYYFGNEQEAALAQIGATARAAGAPFVSAVRKEIVRIAKVFPALRQSADAQWLGLATPRFLLRLPYGAKTDSIERFAFEEMPDPPEHERYLWCNPAIACALLMGEAFARSGWSMRPGEVSQIEGLPAHVYKKDGESELKPCAEVLLTEGSAEMLLELGLMPLLSMKGSDRVRLARFQSIAEPAAPLSGRWR